MVVIINDKRYDLNLYGDSATLTSVLINTDIRCHIAFFKNGGDQFASTLFITLHNQTHPYKDISPDAVRAVIERFYPLEPVQGRLVNAHHILLNMIDGNTINLDPVIAELTLLLNKSILKKEEKYIFNYDEEVTW